MDAIYLDYNATTPIDPAVADAMRPFLTDRFGNPSSSHVFGRRERDGVAAVRRQVAASIGADPSEIVFTSGGTESNNHAIRGVAMAAGDRGNHIVTTAVEHPAVTEVCEWLRRFGFETTYVPVDGAGRVDPSDIERAITDRTVLVTVMHANNEVGTIQPVAEIAGIARARGIPLHTDAAQTMGKLPVSVGDLGVDLLSIAGHKLYGPKGVGALYVREGLDLDRLLHGAKHESGRRAGTENILLLAGLGTACELAAARLPERAEHCRAMRDRLHEGLAERIPYTVLNGHPDERLPNTLSLSVPGIEAATVLGGLPEVAASAGAACHSGQVSVSATLAAMGVSEEVAVGTMRFSTGARLTADEVDRAVEVVAAAVGIRKGP